MDQDSTERRGKFDFTVTHRDPKTGLVTKQDPYILRYVGEGSEKQRLLERPKGSGNLWNTQNDPVGRWVYEEKIVRGKKVRTGKYHPDAEHIVFVPPPTKDQLLAHSLAEKNVQIAELQRELDAIKAEKAKKETPVVQTTKPSTDKKPGA